MPLFAWLFLLSTSSNVQLVDQTYRIPANDWSFVDLGLRPRAAVVQASFQVEAGPPVRLLLLDQDDLERLNQGETHGMVLATAAAAAGRLESRLAKPDGYALVIENRDGLGETSKVRLRVSIESPPATLLSSQRQLAVVALSFAVFFGIVSYSARRLWRNVRR